MTIILRRHFTVRRLTRTPVKYIFSESLIIVDYDGIFINISKYSALFLKVQRFINQVRLILFSVSEDIVLIETMK